MKKLFFVVLSFTIAMTGYAQDVDNFEVGPYEVIYRGEGDYDYQLRKNINLYEYFELKRDTVLQTCNRMSSPMNHGIQVNAFMETCMQKASRYSKVLGISGAWKQNLSNNLYVNGGLSLGFGLAQIGSMTLNMFEMGIPLSVELSNINKKKASLYGSFGIVPAIYSTMSSKYENSPVKPDKYSGIYVAPQVDFGGYVPVKDQLIRVGICLKYKANFTKKNDVNVYNDLLGNLFFGANVGLVF